jgi:putative ABC transport system permease protein
MERFREIGILKSLGWSNSRLSIQILSLSVVQALIGSVLGILIGLLIIHYLNFYDVRLFKVIEFQLQSSGIALLIILSLAGGLIAGIFPIIKLHRTRAGDMIINYM